MSAYTYRTINVKQIRSGQERPYADTVREYHVTISTYKENGDPWLPTKNGEIDVEHLTDIALAATDSADRQRKDEVIPGDASSHFRGWVEASVIVPFTHPEVIVKIVDPSTD